MTTPKDKLPATQKLTAVPVANLPAPWPTQEKVKDLATDLDRRYPLLEAVVKVGEKLSEANDYTRKQIIERAERLQERLERISHRFKDMQKEWDECHPDSWLAKPEESNRPVYSEVAKMITVLMGSFPTSKIPEPEIFVRALMDDVMALEPSFVEMESTCRELRKTNKFMPTISEVIEELEKQKEIWDRRSEVVWFLEEWHHDLPPMIVSEKAKQEQREKEQEEWQAKAEEAKKAAAERKAAKSQPIVAGDRVRNPKAGAGTVTAIEQIYGINVRYRVSFDTGITCGVIGVNNLERLIPGDEGFEPPIPKEVPTCPWNKGVRASDVPIASHTVKAPNNYDDEF